MLMGWLNISTDEILANIFAVQDDSVDMDDLQDFVKYLREMFKGEHINTNLCEESVLQTARSYPRLFQVYRDNLGGRIVVEPGEKRPNLDYFNAAYSKYYSEYLQKISRSYFEQKRDLDRFSMSYEEAARRIEDHMKIHFSQEYPHAIFITRALKLAIDVLREKAKAERDDKDE